MCNTPERLAKPSGIGGARKVQSSLLGTKILWQVESHRVGVEMFGSV